MADNSSAQLKERSAALLRVLADGFHAVRLLLLSGNSDAKSAFVDGCLPPGEVPRIHLGLELSRLLAPVPPPSRAMRTMDFLNDAPCGGVVLFTDIDILFDPGMDIAPLDAFATIARNRTVCVDWPGPFDFPSRRLSYAEPGDPAFREFTLPSQICVLDESGATCPDIPPVTETHHEIQRPRQLR